MTPSSLTPSSLHSGLPRHPSRAQARSFAGAIRGARALAPVFLACSLLLAACGGGVSQVSSYSPSRLVALGDETSVFDDSDGLHNAWKYGVNAVSTSTDASTRSCDLLHNVVQYVADRYGMVFAECNRSGGASNAVSRAKVGAKVDDAVNGLAAQMAEGSLGSSDLVTVWIGTNDVIEVYQRVNKGQYTWDQALAEIQRRGHVAAVQINALLASGAHAIVYTVPDLGLSPYARARLSSADPSDATVTADTAAMDRLSALSDTFNAYLRTGVDKERYDGHNYGLVLADDAVQAITANPSGFTTYLVSPYNVSDAVCLTTLPRCTNAVDSSGNANDLATGATYNTHLWAGDRWLGYPAHYLLGVQSQSRLNALPF